MTVVKDGYAEPLDVVTAIAQHCAEAACGSDTDLEPNASFATAVELPLVSAYKTCKFVMMTMITSSSMFQNPRRGRTLGASELKPPFEMALILISMCMMPWAMRLVNPSRRQRRPKLLTSNSSGRSAFVRIDQFDSDRLVDTAYSLLATLETSERRCTLMEEQCAALRPLRLTCDEDSGACLSFEGEGMIELGERCDSSDDCVDAAQFCSVFDEQRPPSVHEPVNQIETVMKLATAVALAWAGVRCLPLAPSAASKASD